jgi:signal transduction histidine kinase
VFLSAKYPLRDLDGRIFGVGGFSTDITELRRAQHELTEANTRLEATVESRTRELVAARDRAERADHAKSAFLSTVSHELRTPLNSIIGFTDIVLQELAGPLNAEQRRQLAIVQESSRMLLNLINEILDLSRVEAGRLQLSIERFDLADLLRRQVQAVSSQSASKGLSLECTIDAGVREIESDRKRVAQIVNNLLSNAIKFTTHGGASLSASVAGQNVEIEVSDTGPGIAAHDLEFLFRPFGQVGDTLQRPREGTGLGLAISRHLARALGGDIRVASELGVGTRFTATLPLASTSRTDFEDSGLFKRISPQEF